MQIDFESRDLEAAKLRDTVVHRLKRAISRFSAIVPRAKVQLSDINGPRGGVDKRCLVELTTDAGANVVVSSTARNWQAALDQALSRAVRTLKRSWRRVHSTEHEREHQIKRGTHKALLRSAKRLSTPHHDS